MRIEEARAKFRLIELGKFFMEKLTTPHPFWRALRFFVLLFALMWALPYVEVFREEFSGSDFFLASVAWYAISTWILPECFPNINRRKTFFLGWLLILAVAVAVDWGLIVIP